MFNSAAHFRSLKLDNIETLAELRLEHCHKDLGCCGHGFESWHSKLFLKVSWQLHKTGLSSWPHSRARIAEVRFLMEEICNFESTEVPSKLSVSQLAEHRKRYWSLLCKDKLSKSQVKLSRHGTGTNLTHKSIQQRTSASRSVFNSSSGLLSRRTVFKLAPVPTKAERQSRGPGGEFPNYSFFSSGPIV